jgi:hypothetical protein
MHDADMPSPTPRRRSTDRVTAVVAIGSEPVAEARILRTTRHDPSFVTHLIAIAERCPQTRVLRRASPEDAVSAYRLAGSQSQQSPSGLRTQQSV